MIFGLSFGEVALIVLVGAVAFGPKDLPIIARTAGRVTGQAVGYVSALRSRAQTFAEKTQLDELHKELQQTMSQLEAIRYEIRSGANILVPGSMTNRLATRVAEAATGRGIVKGAEGGATSSAAIAVETQGDHQAGSVPPESVTVTATAATSSQTIPQLSSNLGRRLGGLGDSLAESVQSRAIEKTSMARQWDETSSVARKGKETNVAGKWDETSVEEKRRESVLSAGASGRGLTRGQDPLDRRKGVADGRTESAGTVETLPISAVGAGLIPKRAVGGTGGADILSDAIIERQISLQAKEFMKNMAEPPS